MSGTRAWGTIDMSVLETDAFISGILKRTGASRPCTVHVQSYNARLGGPLAQYMQLARISVVPPNLRAP